MKPEEMKNMAKTSVVQDADEEILAEVKQQIARDCEREKARILEDDRLLIALINKAG